MIDKISGSALLVSLIFLGGLSGGCTNGSTRQDQGAATTEPDRGAYLVNLLACGRCHTEGYLTGNQAEAPILSGSRLGIAYTPDREGVQPGLAFADNLTPDQETGLGRWTEADIIRAMTSGIGKNGHQRLPVMPWANYSALTQADLRAIAGYLKSLPPVSRQIPESTREGEPSNRPYVRFGLYSFDPNGRVQSREFP